jgi:3-hydroxyisobutyrate dehydrogenase-like beta-hydroxyacid dehydrogenase
MVVICVSDYAVTSSILDSAGAEEALRGRLVVQLSSGIPKQARALAGRVHRAGGMYLDGAIAAWPRQIGTAEAAIFISGPLEQFDAAKPTLSALAGGLTHSGTDIATALSLFNAALSYFAGHWIGFSYGAAICQAEGLPVDAFGDMLADLSPSLATDLQHMGRVITSGSYANPESRLVIAGTDIGRLVELADDLKIGNDWPIFAGSTFQQAIRAGFGTEEHCAIIKVLSRH